jgi:hypothetical protein
VKTPHPCVAFTSKRCRHQQTTVLYDIGLGVQSRCWWLMRARCVMNCVM